jgi:hypothetical protein
MMPVPETMRYRRVAVAVPDRCEIAGRFFGCTLLMQSRSGVALEGRIKRSNHQSFPLSWPPLRFVEKTSCQRDGGRRDGATCRRPSVTIPFR